MGQWSGVDQTHNNSMMGCFHSQATGCGEAVHVKAAVGKPPKNHDKNGRASTGTATHKHATRERKAKGERQIQSVITTWAAVHAAPG